MNAHDWMRHAALLDAQPSNRRLVQQNPTTRWQPADMARADWARTDHAHRLSAAITTIAITTLFIALIS